MVVDSNVRVEADVVVVSVKVDVDIVVRVAVVAVEDNNVVDVMVSVTVVAVADVTVGCAVVDIVVAVVVSVLVGVDEWQHTPTHRSCSLESVVVRNSNMALTSYSCASNTRGEDGDAYPVMLARNASISEASSPTTSCPTATLIIETP